jgi:hypothetical protein
VSPQTNSILSTTRERFAFAFHHTHGTHIRDGMQGEREIIVDMNRDIFGEKGIILKGLVTA